MVVAELDGSKPVVLVTQGTLANFDLQELFNLHSPPWQTTMLL